MHVELEKTRVVIWSYSLTIVLKTVDFPTDNGLSPVQVGVSPVGLATNYSHISPPRIRPLGRGVERQFFGASASCSNPPAEEQTFFLRQLALVLLAILKALAPLGAGLVSSLLYWSDYQGSLKGHYDHSLLSNTVFLVVILS